MNNQTNNAVQYDKNTEPIVISKPTTDRLLKLDRPSDAMALYWFYYNVAKWKHADCVWANNGYVMAGLKWTSNRLARTKKDLIKLELIEQLKRRWDPNTKRFGKPMVKINFIWWDPKRIKSYTPILQQPLKATAVVTICSKGRDTSNKTIRDTSKEKERNTNKVFLKESSQFDPYDICFNLSKYPKVVQAWNSFVDSRKENKHPITKTSYKLFMSKLIKYSSDEIIIAINKSIACGWRGIFFNDSQNESSNNYPSYNKTIPVEDRDWNG